MQCLHFFHPLSFSNLEYLSFFYNLFCTPCNVFIVNFVLTKNKYKTYLSYFHFLKKSPSIKWFMDLLLALPVFFLSKPLIVLVAFVLRNKPKTKFTDFLFSLYYLVFLFSLIINVTHGNFEA